ncbi:MAG TPA: peptide-methionine (S)-S-oxide reductase MsrA [Patescibacteria group bacterium]|nr:peptide-methionine (S)-S-oxide reductase MsrA [Patescibacteria group bacterium]
METITLAGGCFWCTEAIFSQLKGVASVTPGYSGGSVENPSYEEVCTGNTGHAESVQIVFDPKILALKDLLYVFFKLHDPTTLNRQGADTGTQYRSAIFYSSETQKEIAEKAVEEAKKFYSDPVVTEITKFSNFYPADPSHKDYYFAHRNSPYCILVIDPKIQKLKKEFGNLLKS